jgi:hypothetical protein
MGAAFIIPAIATAAQYFNQRNANQREQNVLTGNEAQQNTYRNNALSLVNQQANAIKNSNPNAPGLNPTGDLVKTLRANVGAANAPAAADTNFGAPTSALGKVPGASSRYTKDAAAAAGETQKYGNTYASEIGNIDAAVKQRQNEALAMQTLTGGINQIGEESYTSNFVNQLRAQAAGQTNPWISLFANMATKGATAAAANSGTVTPTADTSYYGGGNIGGGGYGLPGSTSSVPTVNPWFDTSAQTVP